jgi:hypothetical protein
MVDISMFNGIINQLITGEHHPVVYCLFQYFMIFSHCHFPSIGDFPIENDELSQ